MQKHSDRMDKRAPVSQGAGIPGLGGPDYWSKLDMSALYQGYGGVAGGVAGHVTPGLSQGQVSLADFETVPGTFLQ